MADKKVEVKKEEKKTAAAKPAPARGVPPLATPPAAKPEVKKAPLATPAVKPAAATKAEPAKDVTRVFVPKAPAASKPNDKPAQKSSNEPQRAPVPVSEVRIKKSGTAIKMNGTHATGRRKKSVARVRLLPGNGKITVNGRSLEEYFADGFLRLTVNQPLNEVNITAYDAVVTVHGGGLSGQAGAVRHGIARALVKENETLKPELKKAGFLKRDPRMKERKKYGLKKARRAPQFSKR